MRVVVPGRPQRVALRWLHARADRRDLHERAANGSSRVLPDFLVVGAQKAGTTSVYKYLAQNDRVALPRTKEVHYFDLNYDRGQQWYRSMLPLRSEVGEETIAGEATPYYLFHPLVAAPVRALLPEVRLIALLRDPVERAWSYYRHEVAGGRETASFAEALELEPARLAAAEAGTAAGRPEPAHQNASYVARGRYAEQLQRWFAAFPRDRFHIVIAEELFSDPGNTYDAVLSFLGLPPGHRPAFDAVNARRDTGLDPQLRSRLGHEFETPNAVLATLLGRDLLWTR